MGVYAYDDKGVFDRLATSTGWADLLEWMATLGGRAKQFAEAGITDEPKALAAELKPVHHHDATTEKTRVHFVECLEQVAGFLLASDEDVSEVYDGSPVDEDAVADEDVEDEEEE